MIAVYAHPNGADYVARIDDHDLGWVQWPAERDGWRRRRGCAPAEADWWELPEPLSRLAVLLSGVPGARAIDS